MGWVKSSSPTPADIDRKLIGMDLLMRAGVLMALVGGACTDDDFRQDCVGGCGTPGGPELFGPADPADWTSFRNGPLRSGVAVGARLGDSIRVAWTRPNFMVLAYTAVKPSAAVWEDGLYLASDSGTLWAFDRHSGAPSWSTKLTDAQKGIHGSPAVSKAVVWVGTYGGHVHAVDRALGREVYRFRPGRWVGSSPLYVEAHNAVYVSHETWVEGLPGAGIVTRNDPRTGEAVWTSARLDHYPHSSVAVAPKLGLVVVGANDGRVRTYDSATGALLWHRDFEPGDADVFDADIKTTPAISPTRNLAVLGTWDRHVYALDLTTGETRWRVNTGGILMGSAAIHEPTGRVYVGTGTSRGELFALDLDTGAVVWRLDTRSGVESSPAVNDAGDGLVVGANDGRLWGLDATDGRVQWTFQADGPLTASPAWVGDMIYIAAKQGSLYGLQTVQE